MKFCRIIFCLWLLVCFFPIGIHADIQLPSILSDNMVLQQNAKVRFWGKARPGEKILKSAAPETFLAQNNPVIWNL